MKPTLAQKVKDYKPDESVKKVLKSTQILLMVGISGAGKDTIKDELLKKDDYHHIVSHTTRKMRMNDGILEQNGVEYHFIDFETAETMLDNHAYVEANIYSENIYGTSLAEIQMAHDEGKIAITDMEVQGVGEFMELAPETVKPVFFLPPSYEEWQSRWSKRYSNKDSAHSKDNIDLRFNTAKVELENALGAHYFYFVINENLTNTVDLVDHIAHSTDDAEKYRDPAAEDLARHLLEELNKHI